MRSVFCTNIYMYKDNSKSSKPIPEDPETQDNFYCFLILSPLIAMYFIQ